LVAGASCMATTGPHGPRDAVVYPTRLVLASEVPGTVLMAACWHTLPRRQSTASCLRTQLSGRRMLWYCTRKLDSTVSSVSSKATAVFPALELISRTLDASVLSGLTALRPRAAQTPSTGMSATTLVVVASGLLQATSTLGLVLTLRERSMLRRTTSSMESNVVSSVPTSSSTKMRTPWNGGDTRELLLQTKPGPCTGPAQRLQISSYSEVTSTTTGLEEACSLQD